MNIVSPNIIKVDDYHEFDYIVELMKVFGVKVEYTELDMDGIQYVAYFEVVGDTSK